MNTTEAKKIIAVMIATYPSYNVADVDYTASIWADAFNDISYEVVSIALRNYIRSDTSSFAPTPGVLMASVHKISQPQELSEMQAWSLVLKAIRKSTYYAEEEFNKLPESVKKAIGTPTQLRSMALDGGFNEEVAMSNFQRSYRAIVENKGHYEKSDGQFRQLYDKTNQNSPRQLMESQSFNNVNHRIGQIEVADNNSNNGIEHLDDLVDSFVSRV